MGYGSAGSVDMVVGGAGSVGSDLDWMFDSANPGSTLYKMIVVIFTSSVS